MLGSANCQFSILRRNKNLRAINKDKIGLVDQSLPNVSRMLFGDDFPTIVANQADLSRGLAKNLVSASPLDKHPTLGLAMLLLRISPFLTRTVNI